MPQIQGYDSQVEANAPFGDTNASLESASMVGSAIRGVGEALDTGSTVLHRKEAAQEVSQTYATFAKGRAQWMDTLKQRMANGTLDSQQFNEDYQDWVDKMSDQVQTGEGKDFFNRQASRLQGSLLMTAQHMQSVQAGQKAVADYTTALNANSSSLMQNPAGFHDVYNSQMEAIDAQVKAGVLDAGKAQMLKDHASTELAKGAIRGWAKQDPGSLQDGRDGAATKMLDGGAFDQFLDSDQKTEMYAYAKQQANNADIEKARIQKQRDDADSEAAEEWGQKAIPLLDKNALTTTDVENAPLSADDKWKWNQRIRENASQEVRSNPTVLNAMFRRTQLPDDDPNKIEDISQVLNDPQGKLLSMSDLKNLAGWMKKSPEGQALQQNRAALMKYAQAKLVKKDPAMGIQDPDGEKNLAQFQVDLQQAEQERRQQGKPVMDLYNPTSSDYFGNQVSKYQRSSQELLQSMVNGGRPQTPPPPKAGDIKGGYRFKGGDPKVKDNWEIVK